MQLEDDEEEEEDEEDDVDNDENSKVGETDKGYGELKVTNKQSVTLTASTSMKHDKKEQTILPGRKKERSELEVSAATEERLLQVAASLYPQSFLWEENKEEYTVLKAVLNELQSAVDLEKRSYVASWKQRSEDRNELRVLDIVGAAVNTTEQAQLELTLPYLRDLGAVQQLLTAKIRKSFSTAVRLKSMRRSKERFVFHYNYYHSDGQGRAVRAVKLQALQTAYILLTQGQLVPGSLHVVAAALTVIQLLRFLHSNMSLEPQSIESMLHHAILMETASQGVSAGVRGADMLRPVVGAQYSLPCELLVAAQDGLHTAFLAALSKATVQELRLTAFLGLQLDYWSAPEAAYNTANLVREKLVQDLFVNTLLQPASQQQLIAYRRAIYSTNENILPRGWPCACYTAHKSDFT